ncbi:hypothetical protein GTC6_15371 [Gordonia terrae C-6]|uniref:Uncharacterized protein n=1 Tax=Gordonia terrae C-6 TaxID=1316928 RepID=R7Y808_9ACTN|nr:hypothetical protein GTC6_15371 [Gordonia terrae C-6]
MVGLAVLAPNLLLMWFPPRTPLPQPAIPSWMSGLERLGQVMCLVVPAITLPGEPAWWWSVPTVAGLAGYYALWVRYLRTGRPVAALYRPVWGVPAPMAVLPVLVFVAAAGWLRNPWLGASAVVLAVGHVPAALRIAREVSDAR